MKDSQPKRALRAALFIVLLSVAGMTNVHAQDSHSYVDLGLPSGTLWATCNVGANTPEEYGDYFAWGETQPKINYNWGTYQYCNGSENTLTRYCYNTNCGYNGYTDVMTTLLPEDDAATVNWGSDWRMPTKKEWQELYQYTTSTWTTQNDINGWLYTASNGNSLFLPAAGHYSENYFLLSGSYGMYWSSSLFTDSNILDYPFCAESVTFNSDYYSIEGPLRSYGRTIRAVRSLSQNTSGFIDGFFSVSDTLQVYFSQGNLQYQASTGTWRFADNQWDYVGEGNTNTSSTYDGLIDLFGWGTSGYHDANDPYNVNYMPWSSVAEIVNPDNNTNGYGPSMNMPSPNLTGSSANYDWGVYNAISNGGNQTNQWRTLTIQEWNYVFNTRTTTSGIRYVKAKVNNVNGVILLPDDWSISTFSLNNTNESGASFTSNVINTSQWDNLENAGAVFLPASGYRGTTLSVPYTYITTVYESGNQGFYLSSSCFDSSQAHLVWFYDGVIDAVGHSGRYVGHSVRLVHPIPTVISYSIEVTPNPIEGGMVTGAGSYEEGQACILTATSNEGYTFVNWTENGEEVSTEDTYSFTVTGDRALVANFAPAVEDYHWTVNTYQFPNNMIAIGVIQIEGVEQATNTLELGAFCNDTCRGRERLMYESNLDRYLMYLTLYGEDGDAFTFRLYDHALDQELDFVCASSVTFVINDVLGSMINPYVFNFNAIQTQFATLPEGWMWWSTYIEAEDNDILTQLQTSLGANGLTIKSQSGFVQYSPDFNIWYGSNGFNISNEAFYMVQTNGVCEVEITGVQANPANHPITLANGWNWIGFPCSTHMSFADAFSSISPEDGDIVKSQSHGFASYLEAYNIWFGTLADYGIDPGMGLMYKSNNSSSFSFTYPNGRNEGETMSYTEENNHWTADYNAYPNNMSVTAVVELDDVELASDNYELAAFANGECRGSVRLMYVAPLNRYMAFLTIAGDDAADLNFGLYDNETGTVEAQCITSLQYETNAVVGSFETPYVIRFRGTVSTDEWANSLNVFPNPVARGEQFTLCLTANEIGKVQIEIINALGVVETLRTTSVQTITAPDVAGVYTLRISVEGKGTCYRKLVVR